MIDINPTMQVMILNMNTLNILIKRQRSSEWIKSKTQPYIVLKYKYKRDMVISATWKVEIRRIMDGGQSEQKVSEISISKNKLGMVAHACTLAMGEAEIGESKSEAHLDNKYETISDNIPDVKRARSMTEAVEHVPSKYNFKSQYIYTHICRYINTYSSIYRYIGR
jgi:hypothetical protein